MSKSPLVEEDSNKLSQESRVTERFVEGDQVTLMNAEEMNREFMSEGEEDNMTNEITQNNNASRVTESSEEENEGELSEDEEELNRQSESSTQSDEEGLSPRPSPVRRKRGEDSKRQEFSKRRKRKYSADEEREERIINKAVEKLQKLMSTSQYTKAEFDDNDSREWVRGQYDRQASYAETEMLDQRKGIDSRHLSTMCKVRNIMPRTKSMITLMK